MSDEKSGFGKWLAGILAAVISGVILYHLTDKQTPSPPPVVIQTAQADPITAPVPAPQPKPVQFKVTDNLNLAIGQISEEVKVYIANDLVANLTVDQNNLADTATVEVPSSGRYSYKVLVNAYFVNQYGQTYPGQVAGEGIINVSRGSSFEVMLTPYGVKLEPR